ncbi:MAG: SlyX family protein [Desulfuromonadia bacterium]
MLREHLVELETRIAHDERTIEELNDLVYRQQQTLDRLVAEMEAMRKQLAMIAPSPVIPPDEEPPPPHW